MRLVGVSGRLQDQLAFTVEGNVALLEVSLDASAVTQLKVALVCPCLQPTSFVQPLEEATSGGLIVVTSIEVSPLKLSKTAQCSNCTMWM